MGRVIRSLRPSLSRLMGCCFACGHGRNVALDNGPSFTTPFTPCVVFSNLWSWRRTSVGRISIRHTVSYRMAPFMVKHTAGSDGVTDKTASHRTGLSNDSNKVVGQP